MKWSAYSEAIFEAYRHSRDNLIVQAVPGAGKTTNICHMWGLDDTPTVYLVFNKHTQQEAQQKLPAKPGSDVLTLNGLGHRCVTATFGRVKLDDKKVLGIIRQRGGKRFVHEKERERQYVLAKAVALAKCVDTDGVFSVYEYEEMLSTYDIDDYPQMYSDICDVLRASDEITDVIDFADQLRFPVLYQCSMPQYATVLGDEVQDFNPIQAALLRVLGAQRYVLVGDSHQSIYGFRGAMSDSMASLKATFQCRELPLSINYRCAPEIVAEAAQIYPGIEAWDASLNGTVRHAEAKNEVSCLTADDLVLCRLNRPLIALAYDLLRQGTPCHVRGRDIGQGLVALVRKQQVATVRELISALHSAYDVEMYKAQQREDDAKAQRIEDKYSSALLFCEQCGLDETPECVVDKINSLFETGKGVCLTTVHKAKGLEAHRALLLDTPLFDLFKSRAKQAWQREQECNVHYVAVTRAKRELVYM